MIFNAKCSSCGKKIVRFAEKATSFIQLILLKILQNRCNLRRTICGRVYADKIMEGETMAWESVRLKKIKRRIKTIPPSIFNFIHVKRTFRNVNCRDSEDY